MSRYNYPQCVFGSAKKDNKYFLNCYVCSVSSRWCIHKTTDKHLSNLWYFKKNFTDSPGEYFFCKLCEKWIFKNCFQSHATNDHHLIPWYSPAHELVIYFNNCIQQYENIYYCHLCKCKNKPRNLALNHIDTEKHQMNLKNYFQIKTEVVLSLELNKKFIMNSVFPYQSMQLKCWSCDCYCETSKVAEKHVASDSHKNNLTRLKISLGTGRRINNNNNNDNNLMICNDDISVKCLQPSEPSSEKNKFLEYFENFIGLRSDYFYCNLCQEQLSSEDSVSEHLRKTYHCLLKFEYFKDYEIDIIKSYPPEVYKRYISNYIFPKVKTALKCLICRSAAIGHNCVEDHINGKRHFKSCKLKNPNTLLGGRENILIEVEDIHEDLTHEDMTHEEKNQVDIVFTEKMFTEEVAEEPNKFVKYFENYISECDCNYYCHLCDNALSSSSLVEKHITESPVHRNQMLIMMTMDQIIDENTHLSELSKLFVKNSVFRYDNGILKCFVCKCSLDSCEKAVGHIKSKKHKNKNKLVDSNKYTVEEDDSCETATFKSNDKNSLDTLEDQFIKFFKHFIFFREADQFCNLCEKSFSSSSSVLTHIISDSTHNDLLQKHQINKNFVKRRFLFTPNFYELLVKNNIFPTQLTDLKCFSCERFISGYNVVEEHINSRHHKVNLGRTLQVNALYSSTDDNDIEIIPDIQFVLTDSKEDFAKYFENFIDKRGRCYYCHLCKVGLSSSSAVMIHIDDPKHDNLMRKQNIDSTITKEVKSIFYLSELFVRNSVLQSKFGQFKCFACEINLASLKVAMIHVKGLKHNNNRKVLASMNSTFDQKTVINESNSIKVEDDMNKYFINHIFMRHDYYYCSFCQLKLTLPLVLKHITYPEHEIFVNQYRNDNYVDEPICTEEFVETLVKNNIFQEKTGELFCSTCKCNLFFINAEEHIDSCVHKENTEKVFATIDLVPIAVNSEEEHEDTIVGASKTQEMPLSHLPVSENQLQSILDPKLSTVEFNNNESEFSSQAPSANVFTNKNTKQIMKQCRVCWKKIRFSNELFMHMTSHMWRLFRDDVEDLLTLVNLDSEVKIIFSDNNKRDKVNQLYDKQKDAGRYKSIWKKNKKERKIGANPKVKVTENGKLTMKHLDIELNKNLKKLNIYEMDEELRHSMQLNFNRICIINKEEIYCMICRRSVLFSLQNVYEHLRSIEHLYFLVQMVEDHAKFGAVPNEFSDLSLAREMIEDKSDHHVACYVCDPSKPVVVPNNMSSIKVHIDSENHLHKRIKLSRNLQDFVKSSNLRLERNWFSTQKYWCVICSKQFIFEKLFLRHVMSKTHKKRCERLRESERFIYDHCPVCALLFFGYKKTYFYHSECEFHKFYLDKNINFLSRLPDAAEKLLIEATEIVNKKLMKFDEEKNEMKRNEETLLDDLKNTICDYVDAKIYLFGSRISGLGSIDSDLDIFLDCDDLYYKGSLSDDVSFFLKEVEYSLKQNENIWTIDKVVASARVPIIKITHKLTNIDCDISFTNGLAVENSKLVRKYVDAYPVCKQLILFIKDWLKICNLDGEDGISSYATTWLVIYYLQTKFILPDVAKLMKLKEKSCMIDIWETGVSKDIDVSAISNNFSFNDLLKGFFIMGAGFDYKNNVLCPLLGHPIHKTDFVKPRDLKNLPFEMNRYRNYILNNRKNVKYFRADTVIAVQDPFDLSNNLTKAVKKTKLYRFKTFCKLSAQKLTNP